VEGGGEAENGITEAKRRLGWCAREKIVFRREPRRRKTFNDFHFSPASTPSRPADVIHCNSTHTCREEKSLPLPVVITGLRHHLCSFILSNVKRLSGLGMRIRRMKLSESVSSLLQGVMRAYLFSFQARYSLHPMDG
jgi:hypothetical protein